MNIVQSLLAGSDQLHRKEAELIRVLRMIEGFLELNRNHRDLDKLNGCAPECHLAVPGNLPRGSHWWINVLRAEGKEPRLMVGFFEKLNGGGAYCDAAVYANGKSAGIPMEEVARLHEALPVFIEGMGRLFPRLKKRWQHLLAAADAMEQTT
jgi:hypothetical protein